MNAETVLGHPSFLNLDGTRALDIEDKFENREAVLICGGPSFLSVDHSRIRDSGLLTMTLNNGVTTFRSDLWLGVDSPTKFDSSIWPDAKITKFVPVGRVRFECVREGIHVFRYKRSPNWCSEQIFAPGNTVDWMKGRGSGARTSMVDAIRVLFLLGIRTIYLLGADFHQNRTYSYHHQDRLSARRIETNNRIYEHLRARFAQMRPLMEAAGLHIYNCNPESRLDAFDFRDFPGSAKRSDDL